jgi:hypothetical protein
VVGMTKDGRWVVVVINWEGGLVAHVVVKGLRVVVVVVVAKAPKGLCVVAGNPKWGGWVAADLIFLKR